LLCVVQLLLPLLPSTLCFPCLLLAYYLPSMTSLPPPLCQQLVLELEIGVELLKFFQVSPRSFDSGLPFLVHEYFATPPCQVIVSHLLRFCTGLAVTNVQQHRHFHRRLTLKLLEEADMENVM
jgi:hypothetical protein